MMIVDRFSVGLDDLKRKEQGDMATVLKVLEKRGRFSAFEATENSTIANTMTAIMQEGYAKSVGGAYPWTKVEITEKGRAMIAASPAPSASGQDAIDAARWRALIGSARIRPLGCAGIREPEEQHYAHLGLELWTVFGNLLNDEQRERLAKENALGREWLTKYADIAAALKGQQSSKEQNT
jgi:hypothetical protein